jgi:hypothetical protein
MRATVAKLWILALILCFALPAMAAGDVWAELSKKGDLKITGSNEGNQIMVTNDGAGNVRVVGMPATGTTVRGGTEWTFLETDANTVAGKLDINLKKGDNYLEIDGIDVVGDLKIKLGNGDGTIGIFDADFFDDVSVKMGKGTNLAAVVNVSIGDKLSLKGSSGNDAVAIADCVTTVGKSKIKTSSGDDVFLLQGNYTGALKFDSGKDMDDLYITRFDGFDDVSIKLGGDDDGIWVASTASFFDSVKVNGAQGTDTQTVAPTTPPNAKTKSIETFLTDPATDTVCDDIATALTTEYVARGGDASDISCP